MPARPLKVVLAMEDRSALRHCNRLLSAVGYDVRGSADLSQAADAVVAWRADILVVAAGESWEPALELCRRTRASSSGYLYQMLIIPETTAAALAPVLEAGVDDLVAQPVENAELLSRMRTAVRVLEFERRIGREETTGLLSRRTFLTRFQAEFDACHADGEPRTCVAFALDRYDDLEALYGRPAAAELAQQFLQCVGDDLNEDGRLHALAQLEDRRFAAVIDGDADVARTWAQRLCDHVANHAASAAMATIRYQVSVGMAPYTSEATGAAALLDEALSALRLAQQSGGNCVCSYDEVQSDVHRWTELGAPGRLFENTVIRNMMVPCTLLVKAHDSIGQVRGLLRQTGLQALPAVDDEGKLAGLVTASQVQQAEVANEPVSTVMQRDIASFDEQTSLSAIIDYFAQEAPLVVVIVNKGRPTGLVTPGSMASLIQKLTTESFAPSDASHGRAELIVPYHCSVDGGQLAGV